MRSEARESWEAALSSEAVRDRWADKVVLVPGSDCVFWVGAISGRGHGRFWIGPDRVVIAHRFAFALTHGLEALEAAPLLGHRCDNPLCQRVAWTTWWCRRLDRTGASGCTVVTSWSRRWPIHAGRGRVLRCCARWRVSIRPESAPRSSVSARRCPSS